MIKRDRLNDWVRHCVAQHERGVDRDEVLRALAVLIDPQQTFELRGLPSAKHQVCCGSDLEWAVRAAEELSDNDGVYFTLNVCREDLEGSAKVGDIVGRRWLLVDGDAIRETDGSATDGEKEAAIAIVMQAADWLSEQGWPSPVMIDSGNGAHLLYRVDLPNDKLSQQLLKGVLYELDRRFTTDKAKIDKAMHNASRISKLPGTWARKGPDTPERPHRLARLIFAPSPLEIVTAEQLAAIGQKPEVKPQSNGQPFHRPTSNGPTQSLVSYVRTAVDRECAAVEMTPVGARNERLNVAAFNLGTMAMWPEMLATEARKALLVAAERSGLGELETRRTIESGWTAGAGKPRDRPVEHNIKWPEPGGNGTASDKAASPIIWGYQIKTRKVKWLWPGRIPIGKMTTFAGQTGMGKTFAVCDIAARITTGSEIPFCGGLCFDEGEVLIISAEDDADDTLMPRFLELGGDPRKIAFLSPESEDKFSLAALELLNDSLDAMSSDVRMVAIDPPTSYLGRVNDHRNAELRGLLAPLRRWSVERQVALVFVTHVNKAIGSQVEAISRVMGSVAWVSAVRSAHMFCPDPEHPDRNLFVTLKVNNARKGNTLAYQIEPTGDDLAVLKWIGETEMTADEAMGSVKRKSRGVCAVEWLTEQFRIQREWESVELKRMAADNGLSKDALWSPEVNALPIKKRPRTDPNGDRRWFWIALPDWPQQEVTKDAKVENVDSQPY